MLLLVVFEDNVALLLRLSLLFIEEYVAVEDGVDTIAVFVAEIILRRCDDGFDGVFRFILCILGVIVIVELIVECKK